MGTLKLAELCAVRSESLLALARLDGTIQRVDALMTPAEEKALVLVRLRKARVDLVEMILGFDAQIETLQQQRQGAAIGLRNVKTA